MGERLVLALSFPHVKYERKDEYFLYNSDSFVADVGGYLGLLLGHSIFSIVCSLEEFGVIMRLRENVRS